MLLGVLLAASFLVVYSKDPVPASIIPTKTEYERYLDQMLLVFKDDPKIASVLKKATPEEIKDGIVERILRRIHPDIRSKLDEVKRTIITDYRSKLRIARMDDKIPDDLYKFSDDDLKHLLKERHERIKSMDDQRRKQFHKYEMEKELKHRMMLRAMNEYDRNVQEALDDEEKGMKIERQKKLKHPGAKAQLEDVWEADGFDKGSFNPKAFFKMHDLNGDDEWDIFELEAIFEQEVEVLFEGLNDIDGEEKAEEVSRMREHVTEHMDTDDDGFIQLSEFLEYAKGKEFDEDDPWDTVFSEQFDDTEFDEFEKKLEEEEKKRLEEEALEERTAREEKIRKYEKDSRENMAMLKEHSEKLRNALKSANDFRELEKAKKIIAEAGGKQGT